MELCARTLSSLLLSLAAAAWAEDQVLFNFESGRFDGWVLEGEAFGGAPATGAWPGQSPVAGFCGLRLANSFAAGDAATGRLTSRWFRLSRRHVRFFVGGGDDASLVVRLEIDDGETFEATGAGSEQLRPVVWNVMTNLGHRARLVIEDQSEAAWGHIMADHFTLTDDPSGGPPLSIGPRVRIFDPGWHGDRRLAFNDHCFVRSRAGRWHMFAITFTEPGTPSLDGKLLAHATSPSLTAGPWGTEQRTLTLDAGAGETRLWAPHTVRHDGRWWMYYHAGGADQ